MTASITSENARIARGPREAAELIDKIMATEHRDSESTLYIGDKAYFQTPTGPFPNHQVRVSVRPSAGYAALHYTDHDDPLMPTAISWSPRRPLPDVDLVFKSDTGAVFPRTAAIGIADARAALLEWIRTRARPTCIEWRPYETW